MPKNNKNKYLFLSAIFFFVAFSFLLVTPANAQIANAVSGVIGHVIQFLVYILGGVLFALIYILIWVAQYNDFINAEAVVLGWVIVRDLCNMFFILILLVIAFATILGLENYSIKKNLPKLIIMAILINFSKTICGLFIDFGQVIMLTFVKSFSAMGGGNLTEMLGIKELLKVDLAITKPVEALSVVGSYFLALIYVIIAVVVILVLVAVLVMRMIMMWVYIVLSPLAYLLSTFSAGQKYSQQWWSEFSKNIIVGPLLAFFIWLSFASLGTPGTKAEDILNVTPTGEVPKEVTAIQTEVKTAASTAPIAGVSEAGTPNYMIKFIISIGMLMGGLMVTQDLGARAGSAAGKGIAAIQKGKGMAMGAAKTGAFWLGRQADSAQQALQKKALVQTGLLNAPRSLNYRMIKQGWEASRAEKMRKYEEGAGLHWQDTFTKWTNVRNLPNVAKTKGRMKQDNEEADKLEEDNEMLDFEIRARSAQGDEQTQKIEQELYENKDKIVDYHKKKGLSQAEANQKFINMVGSVGQGEHEKLEKQKNNNEEKITNLRRDVIGWGKKYKPIYGDMAQNESIKKEEDKISSGSTDSNTVMTQMLEAFEEKDNAKMMAALKILTKNNDLNEALKDPRMQNLMTKQNGLLEKILGEQLNPEELKAVKADYKQNNVTPAYAQAMLQGLFKQAGTGDRIAAQYMSKLGEISISGGNGLMYGAVKGNMQSGAYDFDKLSFRNGRMEVSEDRQNAIIGKLNNFESQAKMRNLHPDTIIMEDSKGNASGIHEGGEAFLKALSAHDLGQIGRLRLDVVQKIGKSPEMMRDAKRIVAELDKSTNEADKQQAKIIKQFFGYIKSRAEGEGIKDSDEYIEAWDEKIANTP